MTLGLGFEVRTVRTNKSVTLFHVNFITSTEFHMAKCHTLMCINPKLSVTLWCGAPLYGIGYTPRTISSALPNNLLLKRLWDWFFHFSCSFNSSFHFNGTIFYVDLYRIILSNQTNNTKMLTSKMNKNHPNYHTYRIAPLI